MDLRGSKLFTFLFALVYITMVNAIIQDSDSFIKPEPTDPWYNLPLPPEPTPGHFRFLGGCIDAITKPYIKAVFNAIFSKELVNDPKCCQKLIETDYKCYKSLADILGRFDKFKNNVTLINEQTSKIYQHCDDIIPYSKE